MDVQIGEEYEAKFSNGDVLNIPGHIKTKTSTPSTVATRPDVPIQKKPAATDRTDNTAAKTGETTKEE